mgnify:CR=1 FL=1
MTTSSVFLVTYNDGDYYTRYDDVLAAFTSRDDAAAYALGVAAAEVEVYGDVREGLCLVERAGADEVSRVDVVPLVGFERDEYEGSRVTDRDAVYRSLERILFS